MSLAPGARRLAARPLRLASGSMPSASSSGRSSRCCRAGSASSPPAPRSSCCSRCASWSASPRRRPSPPMPASSRPGSRPTSAAPPRPSSIPAQYFATVLFAPLMGWIVHDYGWRYVFFVMGALGVIIGLVWIKIVYGPKEHPGDQPGRARLHRGRRRAGRHGRAEGRGRAPEPVRAGTTSGSCSPTACCSASISASTASRR